MKSPYKQTRVTQAYFFRERAVVKKGRKKVFKLVTGAWYFLGVEIFYSLFFIAGWTIFWLGVGGVNSFLIRFQVGWTVSYWVLCDELKNGKISPYQLPVTPVTSQVIVWCCTSCTTYKLSPPFSTTWCIYICHIDKNLLLVRAQKNHILISFEDAYLTLVLIDW